MNFATHISLLPFPSRADAAALDRRVRLGIDEWGHGTFDLGTAHTVLFHSDLITARQPADLTSFMRETIEVLRSQAARRPSVIGRSAAKISNYGRSSLLRERSEWSRQGRATDQSHELAPSHRLPKAPGKSI